ncbi:NAC domain-containing protein [Rhizoctonia solani]|nr:NAC domain-containing protein [Rhizoctonia solani]
MNAEKLAKLQAAAAANRIGGKGSVRRKVVPRSGPKVAGGDDKKLAAGLKKLNVQPIAPIEEVNMFLTDGNVLHFTAPKVHGAHSSNTFAIYGAGHVKDLTELVPGILNQLGPDSLASLRRLAESYQAMQRSQAAGQAGAPADDDDEVPDLIGAESFEVPEGDKPAAEATEATKATEATEATEAATEAAEPAAEATPEATKANDVD